MMRPYTLRRSLLGKHAYACPQDPLTTVTSLGVFRSVLMLGRRFAASRCYSMSCSGFPRFCIQVGVWCVCSFQSGNVHAYLHTKSMSEVEPFSLFTTIRFTWPCPVSSVFGATPTASSSPCPTVIKAHVPLVDRHIARLRTAHHHFARTHGAKTWGEWPGDEVVWEEIRRALQSRADEGHGDYRVGLVFRFQRKVGLQLTVSGAGAAPSWRAYRSANSSSSS